MKYSMRHAHAHNHQRIRSSYFVDRFKLELFRNCRRAQFESVSGSKAAPLLESLLMSLSESLVALSPEVLATGLNTCVLQ